MDREMKHERHRLWHEMKNKKTSIMHSDDTGNKDLWLWQGKERTMHERGKARQEHTPTWTITGQHMKQRPMAVVR